MTAPAAKRRQRRRTISLAFYSLAVFAAALAAFDMMGGLK